MLSTEIPINNPNNPPQLEMNSDIVFVSERLMEMKGCSLNDIRISLFGLLDTLEKNQWKWISNWAFMEKLKLFIRSIRIVVLTYPTYSMFFE